MAESPPPSSLGRTSSPLLLLPTCSSARAPAPFRLAAMAMNHGWGQPAAPPPLFEQILGTRDCDSAIGELVLRGDVARLFAPGFRDRPFDYNATLKLSDGRRVVVRVYKAAAGRDTLLREGWRDILEDFNLMPGDFARFEKSLLTNSTFCAFFRDPDGYNRLSRFDVGDGPPSSPDFRFEFELPDPHSSPEFAPVYWLQPRQAEGGRRRVKQAAGAAAWGDRALHGDDMTIREAMDLAVVCGAREGSDEHYMATKLFMKAENRAMFLTFSTNAGRLQWLRRYYEDRMN